MLPTKTKVGVLLGAQTIRNLHNKKQIKFNIKELLEANKSVGTELFFFSKSDVHINRKYILATYYDDVNQNFKKRVTSYPHVLYSRTRAIDHKSHRNFRKHLKHSGVLFLNSKSAFDKWLVHLKLVEEKKFAVHLPLTKLYHPKALQQMFKQTDTIYIKSRTGRKGFNIIQVRKVGRKTYEYKYFLKKLVHRRVTSISKLTRVIRKALKGKKAIMQAEIKTIKLNGKIIDMRAEVQRNKKNELNITDLFVKLGAPNAHITNLLSGATFHRFEPFFSSHLKYSEEQIKTLKGRIVNFVKEACLRLESIYGNLGETAIDFALDNGGKLCL